MKLPLKIADDLLSGDIDLEKMFLWYGDKKEVFTAIHYLATDSNIQIYLSGQDNRYLHQWEIENLYRCILENRESELELNKIFIQLIDKGAKMLS